MTVIEYSNLPVGEPNIEVDIGYQYKPKSDRQFKQGDHTYYFEAVNKKVTDFGFNIEYALKYTILE